MIVEILLTLTVALVAYLYTFFKSKYAYFKERGFKNKPVDSVFGNIKEIALQSKHMVYVLEEIYNAFPSERIIGYFELVSPLFMIRDPDLIKHITVKDFDNFVDRRTFFSDETDQIFGSSLFALKGDKWRDMRSTLSPAFTGSKMRNMCPFILECGQQVVEYLKKECSNENSSNEPGVDVEMKDLFTRFATDVIATTAFGCKVNSLEEKNNEFFLTGNKLSSSTSWQMVKAQLTKAKPKLCKYLKISFFHPTVTSFFKNIFSSTVKYREENNIVRSDMINILMEVKKGSLHHEAHEASDYAGFATVEESEVGMRHSKRVWTDDELVSQVFLFFFAGFETVSTMLSFTSMELVLNPEIQDRLRAEVDAHYPENGNLTYESIQKMIYLDMVVSEGLRIWTPVTALDRMCIETYNVPNKDGSMSNLTIEKGRICTIPVQPIHNDPKYWDEPRKFDPERFSPENKHKIAPFTYFPFGSGPRNCIGSRFALMEVKIILFYLIRNFKLIKIPKTMDPIVLPANTLSMKLDGGFWMKIIPRDDL